MKIMITWLRKDGICRSWTNADPSEHGTMSVTITCDSAKRLAPLWNKTKLDVITKLAECAKKILKEQERIRRGIIAADAGMRCINDEIY